MLVTLVAVGCGFSARAGESPTDSKVDGPRATGEDAGVDGTAAGTCMAANQRVCIDSKHSGYCDSGLQKHADRDCPPGSSCVDGYCGVPAGATPCTSEGTCINGQVCDLYTVGMVLAGFCTTSYGNITTGSCSAQGSDPLCHTGWCVQIGETQRCLRPCNSSSDCLLGSSQACDQISSPTTIEGTTVAGQKACWPD